MFGLVEQVDKHEVAQEVVWLAECWSNNINTPGLFFKAVLESKLQVGFVLSSRKGQYLNAWWQVFWNLSQRIEVTNQKVRQGVRFEKESQATVDCDFSSAATHFEVVLEVGGSIRSAYKYSEISLPAYDHCVIPTAISLTIIVLTCLTSIPLDFIDQSLPILTAEKGCPHDQYIRSRFYNSFTVASVNTAVDLNLRRQAGFVYEFASG